MPHYSFDKFLKVESLSQNRIIIHYYFVETEKQLCTDWPSPHSQASNFEDSLALWNCGGEK